MSDNSPKAMLDSASAAADGGNGELAKDLLRMVIAGHPNSPEAAIARTALGKDETAVQRVRVVDLDISFMSMVGLFIKAAIAVIPAAIILSVLGALIFAVVGGLLSPYGPLGSFSR